MLVRCDHGVDQTDQPERELEKVSSIANDPHDLNRYVQAQDQVYEQALREIRSGRKQSHWMWFIFPQFEGLGYSSMAKRYAIKSFDEARAYLMHPLLGSRLKECAEAVLGIEGTSAHDLLGSPDDLKLRSCATLFAQVAPPGSVFHRLLEKYYQGLGDEPTLRLLAAAQT